MYPISRHSGGVPFLIRNLFFPRYKNTTQFLFCITFVPHLYQIANQLFHLTVTQMQRQANIMSKCVKSNNCDRVVYTRRHSAAELYMHRNAAFRCIYDTASNYV